MLHRHKKIKRVILALLLTTISTVSHAGDIRCGADTTGNGAITQLADCNAGSPFPYAGITPAPTVANSNLCPIDQTNCSMRQYRCPEDNNVYTDLTTCTDQCIKTQSCNYTPFTINTRNCPDGFSFQDATYRSDDEWGGWGFNHYLGCVSEANPCPSGTALIRDPNTSSFLCRQLTFCPDNYYPSDCFCLVQGSEWEGVPMTCNAGRTPTTYRVGTGFNSYGCNCEGNGLPAAPSCPNGGYFHTGLQKCVKDSPNITLCTRRWLWFKITKASNSKFYLQYIDTGPSFSSVYHNECEPPTFADPVTGGTWHTIETIDLSAQIPAGTIDQWNVTVKFCMGGQCVTTPDTAAFYNADLERCDRDFFGSQYNCRSSSPTFPYYYEVNVTANDFTCPIDGSLSCTGPGTTKTCSQNKACNTEPVCPVSFNCNCTDGTTPTCSSIGSTAGTFNPNLNSCVVPTGNLCPSGTTWDGSSDGCLSTPGCDTGGTFNDATNFCEAPVNIACLDNSYTYNSITQECEQPISCPTGTVYDSVTHKCTVDAAHQCQTGFSYDAATKSCYQPSTCPNPLVLNTVTNKCEAPLPCATGATYDAVTDKCIEPVTCSAGSVLNAQTDRCEKAPSYPPTCLTGTTFDQITNTCAVAAGACTTPGSLNTNTDRCETSLLYNCSYGSYDSSSGSCLYTPSCPSTTWPYGAATPTGAMPVTCPAGGTLTGSTPLCQVSATWVRGFWYGGYWSCPSQSWYSYTNLNNGYCQLQLSCPSGTTYNSSAQQCVPDAPACISGPVWSCYWNNCTISCAGGYSWNLAENTCTASVSCPSGTSFNLSLNRCVSSPAISCPAGYASNGSICTAPPNCLTGTTYNAARDRCEATPQYLPTCDTGYLYDPVSQKCYAPASCLNAFIYNSLADRCEIAPTCYSGSSQNTLTDRCEAPPICPASSTFVNNTNRCEMPPVWSCPVQGTTIDTSYGAGVCSMLLTCPSSGNLSGTSPLCSLHPDYNCPQGYVPDNGVCKEVASCTNGSLDVTLGKCKLGGATLCPSDWSFESTLDNCKHIPGCNNSTYDATNKKCCTCASTNACITSTPNPTISDYFCSPNVCIDTKAAGAITPGQGDLTYVQDDLGFNASNGGCAGQIFVFTGRPSECRTSGSQTTWHNCCDDPTGGIIGGVCTNNEVMTHSMVDSKLCHYVGDYCAEEWMFVGCVQEKRMYCCWDSKLARIIQEQGRAQLQKFNTAYCPSGDTAACAANNTYFNSALVPDCIGLKPEELQMLDWSKIDLSEYFTDVQVQMQNATQGLQQNMSDSITNFYNQIRP